MSINLQKLVTESRNPASEVIDTLSTLEMLKVINAEDKKVPEAVAKALPEIAQAVDVIAKALQMGGRLIYVGAGTSGRLGILDASECPPTFGSDPNQVVGLIAGGHRAILAAVENAEDNLLQAEQDLTAIDFNKQDVLVGIAASGRTPYVLGAMAYANRLGAVTVSVACNPDCEMANLAEIAICAVVGPEVVTGSSRMKAGTAQKLILNMLTTGAMIRIGKVYGNLMVDVEATNAKLVERQKNIVMAATECNRELAEQALVAANGHCKTAIVMILAKLNASEARAMLAEHQGFIRPCLA